MNQENPRHRIIVFDVNETLLDIEILNPFFERTFGESRVMRQWFAATEPLKLPSSLSCLWGPLHTSKILGPSGDRC